MTDSLISCAKVGSHLSLRFVLRSARQLERVEELDLVLAHLPRRDKGLLVALADVVSDVPLKRVEGDGRGRCRRLLRTLLGKVELLGELVLHDGHLVLHLDALLPVHGGRDHRPAVGREGADEVVEVA